MSIRIPILLALTALGLWQPSQSSAQEPLIARLRRLAASEPHLVLPAWAGERNAWTVVGVPGHPVKTLVGSDGVWSPRPDSFSISVWVYDQQARRLFAQEELPVERSLMGGYLPVSLSSWQAGPVAVSTSLFASLRNNILWDLFLVELANDSHQPVQLMLYLAIRPYCVGPGHVSHIAEDAGLDGEKRLRLNALFALVLPSEPHQMGWMAGPELDVSRVIQHPEAPLPSSEPHAGESISGSVGWHLDLQPGATFRLPLAAPADPVTVTSELPAPELTDTGFHAELTKVSEQWKQTLNQVSLDLPDDQLLNASRASLANLLITKDGSYLRSGPTTLNQFRIADAALMVDALLKSGLTDTAADCLQTFLQAQLPSGQFATAFRLPAERQPSEQWDAQGQAIYALMQYYRLTGEKQWLEAVYPAMKRACGFLQSFRQQHLGPEWQDKPEYGLLPARLLGEQPAGKPLHHYADDFWSLFCLRETAEAAHMLGKEADRAELTRQYDDLRRALFSSLGQVMEGRSLSFIPGSLEVADIAPAARDLTSALWPCRLLDPSARITRDSFQTYWERAVEPKGGGFMVDGTYRPASAMALAHAFLYLDRPDRMWRLLRFALEHQTAPGTYAWAQAADLGNHGFAGGDMPHCRASAEWTLLLRDLLLMETDRGLELFAGVPASWLSEGRVIAFGGAPTYWGKVSAELESHLKQGRLVLRLKPERPEGLPSYVVRVPNQLTLTGVSIDGKRLLRSQVGDHEVKVPPTAQVMILEVRSENSG